MLILKCMGRRPTLAQNICVESDLKKGSTHAPHALACLMNSSTGLNPLHTLKAALLSEPCLRSSPCRRSTPFLRSLLSLLGDMARVQELPPLHTRTSSPIIYDSIRHFLGSFLFIHFSWTVSSPHNNALGDSEYPKGHSRAFLEF